MTTKTKTMVFSIMVPVNPKIPAHVQRWMRDNLADHIRQEFNVEFDPEWVTPAWPDAVVIGPASVLSSLVETVTHIRPAALVANGGANAGDEWSHDAIVARMKAEITADIERQVVPDTVTAFDELHEYVDANCYGGFTDPACPFRADSQADANRMNAATADVQAWLKAGRP